MNSRYSVGQGQSCKYVNFLGFKSVTNKSVHLLASVLSYTKGSVSIDTTFEY